MRGMQKVWTTPAAAFPMPNPPWNSVLQGIEVAEAPGSLTQPTSTPLSINTSPYSNNIRPGLLPTSHADSILRETARKETINQPARLGSSAKLRINGGPITPHFISFDTKPSLHPLALRLNTPTLLSSTITMATDPLSPQSILKHMADALPTHAKGDTNSDLSSSYEAIGLFAHACMTAVGFRLLGFGEDQKIEAECQRLAPRLSTRWNSSFGSHSFLYAHSQSSMQYVVKVDRLGGKAEIRGIGLGDDRISRFEITAKDYVSSAALPLRITLTADGEEDRSDLEAKLKEIFISPSRIQDLATEFKLTIIQKLMPGLHKEGYEEAPNAGSSAAQDVRDEREEAHARRNPRQDPLADPRLPESARPYPFQDPLAADPRRPLPQGDFPPPGFDDEYDLNRPLRGMARPFPGAGSPFNIGHDDLNPAGLGPNDPLRGSFVGGGLPRPGGFGGMHPTFDDPLFGGRGQGRGQDPRAPPGARYDPIGPGDGPQRGGGGRPPNPFGGFGGNDFI